MLKSRTVNPISIQQHLQHFSVLNPNAKTFKPISTDNILFHNKKSYKIAEKAYVAHADVCCHSDMKMGKCDTNHNSNDLNPNGKHFQPKTSIDALNPDAIPFVSDAGIVSHTRDMSKESYPPSPFENDLSTLLVPYESKIWGSYLCMSNNPAPNTPAIVKKTPRSETYETDSGLNPRTRCIPMSKVHVSVVLNPHAKIFDPLKKWDSNHFEEVHPSQALKSQCHPVLCFFEFKSQS